MEIFQPIPKTNPQNKPPKMKILNLSAVASIGLAAGMSTSCSNMDNMSAQNDPGTGNQMISTGTHQMGPPGRSQPMADSAMPRYASKPSTQQR